MRAHFDRPLTEAELSLARGMFGQSIDYARVRLHAAKRYPFQPRDCAMAPDGHIWFPPACFRSDFSTDPNHAAWLVHELTHVWQHQQGIWVRLRGCFERRYRYGDLAADGRPFARYGIEQQAAIVEDYWRLSHGHAPRHGSGALGGYERLLPFTPRAGPPA